MACNLVLPISGTECIGDSRTKINNNFSALESVVCSLSSNAIYVTNTDTIDLAFTPSTRTISGIVKTNSLDSTHLKNESVGTAELSAQAVTSAKIAPDTVRYSQLASWQSLSATSLSAEAVQPRVAKAWVCFNGVTRQIRSAFNVSSISLIGAGQYEVNLISPVSLSAAAVCGGDNNYPNTGTYAVELRYHEVAQISTTKFSYVTGLLYGTAASFGIGTYSQVNFTDNSLLVFSQ